MAIRLNKIYTRSGDDGKTALVGGRRVSKGDLKIEAYGSVDELNCFIGLIRAGAGQLAGGTPNVAEETESVFKKIQNELFDIGSILATPAGESFSGMAQINAGHIEFLEKRMDGYQKSLGDLDSFVLPGGGMLSSYAHVARAVCRRVERILVRLVETEPVSEKLMGYINRLSDFLFVYARWVSHKCGEPERLWER